MNKRNHFKSGFLRAALMLALAVMIFPLEAWADSLGTFPDLSNEIGSGGDIELSHNSYEYNVGDVIVITYPGTINGCGATIDMGGSNISVFNIVANNVIIKNLTIQNASNTAIVVGGDNCIIENCTFIGNNATNSSGAIYVIGKACTIKNCAFINNGETTISYSSSSAPTVKDNWFGNTADDYKTAPATGVQMENWLFLDAIADPQKILKGESSEVVFRLYSYDGNSVSEYDKMDVRLDLSPILGTLDKAAASLGEVITYTVSEVGQAGVTATFGTVSYTVDILNAVSTGYIDVDGNKQTAMACPLNGTETALGKASEETWYVCNSDVSYDHPLFLNGNVHLILGDGAKMNIGSSDARITDNPAIYPSSTESLTIYGQSAGTGALSVYTDNGKKGIPASSVTINGGNVTVDAKGEGSMGISSFPGDITINGGKVTATATDADSWGLYALGKITINGGTVDATGGYDGLRSDGGDTTINGGKVTATGTDGYGINANYGFYTITLGWKNATDFMHANSYSSIVKIIAGKYFYDGSKVYGSATADYVLGAEGNATIDDIAGKTLIPAMSFKADKLYVVNTFEGNWKVAEGAKTFLPTGYNLSTGQVTLEEVIGAPDGLPVIIGPKDEKNPPDAYVLVPAQDDEVDDIEDNYDNVAGEMSKRFVITDGTKTLTEVISGTGVDASEAVILVLANGKFTSVDFSADDLKKKAKAGLLLFVLSKWEYMQIKPATQPANATKNTRTIGIDFGGETTGIKNVHNVQSESYYDLQGRCIAQPTRKGFYIRNGKKIIIK